MPTNEVERDKTFPCCEKKPVNSEQFIAWRQTRTMKPLIMGVLNVTPDSFSDAGQFLDPSKALQRALDMIEQGADIIDIGGESSRPGAAPISCNAELARVIPVIEHIRASLDICLSIDTCKADVMEAAVAAGASMINDINALRGDGVLAVVARLDVPVCLMHMQGAPDTMQNNPYYSDDIVDEINQFFHLRIEACTRAGIARERLILDPGFGFGKSVQHNLRLVNRLVEFQQHRLPVLLGVSRKSTLGAVLQKNVHARLLGGLAVAVFAAQNGASIIRTHDVDETNQALQMLNAVVCA